MQNHFVLEICVESVDCAVAAERGDAQRVELCSDLAVGGITPSVGLMQIARKNVRLPIHVIIRPRAGNFHYSHREIETMEQDIRTAKDQGMDGVVLGVLDAKDRIDVPRTTRLVKLAHPLPVTFHRAFDSSRNLRDSLEAVIQTGATRILTSGGRQRATEGLTGLARLVEAAEGRITIMPGGGINATNVVRVVRRTSAREIHTSLGLSSSASARPRASASSSARNGEPPAEVAALERKVRMLRNLISGMADDSP